MLRVRLFRLILVTEPTARRSSGFINPISIRYHQKYVLSWARNTLCPSLVYRAGVIARAFGGGGDMNTTFLSLEEAGLVDFAPIDMHEKFLARLTVSSLNLLKVIAKEEDCTIEELNAGRIADWFTKDNERRQTDPDDAVLKW